MKYKNACSFCLVYYPKIKNKICPLCNSALHDVDMTSTGKGDMSIGRSSGMDVFDDVFEPDQIKKHDKKNLSLRKDWTDNTYSGIIIVTGTLQSHTENREVSRFIISKFIDFVVNSQSFSDTTQSFTISGDDGRIYNALVYGEFRGFVPNDGAHIEVTGRINKSGILMIEMMRCEGAEVPFYNNNFRSYWNNQNSPQRRRKTFPSRYDGGKGFIAILLIIAVLAFIFIPAVQVFVLTWLVMFVLTFAVAGIIKPLEKMTKNSIILVLVSLILTLCFYNVGGIGTGLMSILGSIGSNVAVIVILCIGLWLMYKSIK